MIDIKATREEMAVLHAQAETYLEKYSKSETPATEAEEKEQSERFSKLEKLAKQIDDAEKLARFSFSKEGKPADQPTAKVVMSQSLPIEMQAKARETYSREEYAAGLSSWVRGDDKEEYATISVSGNSAIVPVKVVNPLTPVKYNCYRAAYGKLGFTPETFGNTAPAVMPVITSTSGGLIPEGVQNSANDAAPAIGTVTLTAHGYQSKTYWYSNELINSETWDVTSSTLPALQGAREYGFAAAVTAGIVADGTITQTVTTATHSTLIIDNLDALIHSFSLLWDNNKAIFLGMDVYAAAEQLKDSNGRPIFEFDTIQDDRFVSYKGVPVFKHDTFQPLTTAGNVVGCCVSFDGFKLRDEMEKLIKYVDQAAFIDQTGLNNVRYMGYGYVPAAITKLVAGT